MEIRIKAERNPAFMDDARMELRNKNNGGSVWKCKLHLQSNVTHPGGAAEKTGSCLRFTGFMSKKLKASETF